MAVFTPSITLWQGVATVPASVRYWASFSASSFRGLGGVMHTNSSTSGSTGVRLYCSSANQYNWLKAYAGQEITVELAACNWNSKDYYTGCVLAVRNTDGTKTLNELNFNN